MDKPELGTYKPKESTLTSVEAMEIANEWASYIYPCSLRARKHDTGSAWVVSIRVNGKRVAIATFEYAGA